MKNLLALLGLMLLLHSVNGQSNFSFSCTKDTSIICTTSCITLKTTIPDIFSSTNTYVADQISARSCFRGYVNPAAAGTSANLSIDDRYSPVIDIGFPFSFFGFSYTKLIASTNGYLSFDVSKTGTFSHFGILKSAGALSSTVGAPEDLPSPLYDRALIMGPYHDLDPNTPTQQIKYDVTGTAPYRKWILSYYKVPLYTTACLNLGENTHQIVLYETLGIVEIFIYDKQICTNWNNGRSIIGMQDFNKSSYIMAPGRQATSAPWGTIGMNESWRFIPAAGASLFKRVELYTLAGSFVTAGATTPVGNNQLGVSFNNVCPPGAGGTYLVKSFYKNPNNPAAEVIGIDTINILRGDPVGVKITSAACSPGSKGSITVTSPVGAIYEYSIDGINWQLNPSFNLPVGVYTLRARIAGSNCISTKIVTIATYTFEAAVKVIVTPCPGPISASIEIFPNNGTPPYLYSLNGGPFQSSNLYTGLAAGTYTFVVKDAAGCTYSNIVNIGIADLASAEVTNTICSKPGSGSIKVQPKYGFAPFTYSINGGPFQSSDTFNNLLAGTYHIVISDSAACLYDFDVTVNADVQLNTNTVVVMPKCFGNSNGSFSVHPSSGTSPYLFALGNNAYQADSVFNNLPAGNYSLHVKDFLGCVKDTNITIQQPNGILITSITISASDCFTANGLIIIKANGGTTPYIYSIDNGINYQTSTAFTVGAGAFNILVKDINGCTATHSLIVDAVNNKMKVNIGADKTICAGSSVILNSITDPPATNFKWTPSTGLNDSASASPVASPLDTTTYILKASTAACFGADTITVNILHKPIVNAGNDTLICNNTFAILMGSATNLSGTVNYLWIPSAELVSPNLPVTIVRPKTTRAHFYRLQVTDNYGCNFNVYDDVKVFVDESVIAFAGNDTIAAIGFPHQLFGSGGTKYLWSPANFLDNPSAQNPIAILQSDTRFNLLVKDTFGCSGTSSVFVKVYTNSTFYIPNAFTPNGDGLNDIFRATSPGIKQLDYFRIYNRLGQLLYETKDLSKGWDGKYLNRLQPPAVYVWIIRGTDAAGKKLAMKGSVTLIR